MKANLLRIVTTMSLLTAGLLSAQIDQPIIKLKIAPPSSQLSPTYCGITLSSTSQVLYSDPVLNAENYEYRVTNKELGFRKVYKRGNGNNDLNVGWIPGLAYGTSYNVQVKPRVQDEWGDFGKTCKITTTVYPGTEVSARYCGSALTSLHEPFYVEAVERAEDYEYLFSNAELGFTTTVQRGSSSPEFSMDLVPGVRYGTTYNVAVRAKTGGVWGDFEALCKLTTPAFPLTNLSATSCETVLSSWNQPLLVEPVTGAVNYEYLFIDTASGFNRSISRGGPATDFYPFWLQGLQHGTTYFVKVRANVGGEWGSFGQACKIKTPDFPITQLASRDCGSSFDSSSVLIHVDSVSGAQDYQYHFVSGATGFNQTVNRGNAATDFNMAWLSGLRPDVVYSVFVRANIAGTWGPTGEACTIRFTRVNELTPPNNIVNNSTVIMDAPVPNGTQPIMSVYPNPVLKDEVITVDLQNVPVLHSPVMYLNVYDLKGNLIQSEQFSDSRRVNLTIDDHFKRDSYFLEIVMDDRKFSKRIIVK